MRKTALFLRIVRAMLCALVLCFTQKSVFAYSENSMLMCHTDVLKSDTSATFEAIWCEKCSDKAEETASCTLNTDGGICTYSGICDPELGYDPNGMTNAGTPNMECSLQNYNMNYELYINVTHNGINTYNYSQKGFVLAGYRTVKLDK